MRTFSLSLFPALCCIALLAATGCTTGSIKPATQISLEGSFSTAGLEGIKVNNFNIFKDSIYASTDRGLYEKTPGSTSWLSRGLQQDSVLDVVFLPGGKLLAAIHIPGFSRGTPSLFLSTNNGQTWQPHMGNYGGENGKFTVVYALAINPGNKSILFARGGANVSHSTDGGKTWKSVFLRWEQFGGYSSLLKIDKKHSDIIWAGGAAATGAPYLIKSTDGGGHWGYKDILNNVETNVTSIVISSSNDNNLLVGMASAVLPGNVIRKSTDGGQTWHTVQDSTYTLTLTHSARDPQVVYASGQNANGALFFAASKDFGDTWQTIDMPDSPTGIYVNDMVSVMQNGHEVLYLGTNKGVYSYTFEE